MSLPNFSVKRRVTVTMLILILMLFGGLSFTRLGLDMMPDLEFPILNVITAYPGAAAEDVEQLVTRPVESAVSGLKGLDRVTSTSAEGLSTVTVQFEWGSDIDVAAQDMREALNRIGRNLPTDAMDPMVMKFDMSMMPIILSGVTGMENATVLQKYLEDAIVPRIERLPGVGSMVVVGAAEREINIFLNRMRLNEYGIPLDAVIGAIRGANLNISSGYVSAGHQEFLIRTMGEFSDLETIANTVITTIGGAPIRVGDVARVEDTKKEMRGTARLNGREGVVMVITKQSGTNTLEVTQAVERALEELRPIMPPDIEFHKILNQGDIVSRIVNNSTESVLIGALLAIIILWAFLRNWRPTFVIALAIPISVLTTFIGMYAMGYTLNIITIGGFALAVGMLVDNAVVVIENIYRHLEEGKHRNEAAVVGANEVGLAIAASTLTTVAVFVPLALAGGMAGMIARPLALTVCAGLASSLLVAVTIVPMLSSVIFKKAKGKKRANDAAFQAEAHGGKIFTAVKKNYIGALGWVLNHRTIVVIGTVILFAAAVGGIIAAGGEFMGQADNGMGSLDIKMPVGTNFEETDRLFQTIENYILTIPEVMTTGAMVGRLSEDGATGDGDVNEGTIFFRLVDFKDRQRSTKAVTAQIREAIPELHDVVIEFSTGGGMGSSVPIELKFFGTDLEALTRYANEAKAVMDTIESIHDVVVSMREGKPELRLYPDRDRIALMGFNMADIGNGIRTANLGQVVTRFREAGDEFDVRIRLDQIDRETKDQIYQIPVVSRTGVVTQVANLGEMIQSEGPMSITRENRVRVVTVTAQTDSRDIRGEVQKVQTALRELEANMPNGYFIEYGGSYKDMEDTFGDLMLALILAVVLIYMVMAAQFESFTQPFIIMFTVPLAFIGVAMGLLILGHPLSVSAFMGIIVLVGIVVNNGIVLVSCINDLRREGMPMRDALIRAGELRLRPIFITSLTTIMGMLPMAFSTKQGSEMQAPMGIAVSFGLAASTFLTLFVVPVFYSIVDGISHTITAFLKKKVLGETHDARETLQGVPVVK